MRAFCPACGDDTLTTTRGLCSVCDTRITGTPRPNTTAEGRRDRGRPACDPALVDHAYHAWYINERLSVRRCADRLLEQPGVYYASRNSAAAMLVDQWRIRGYPLRDRIAATIAASWKDGRQRRHLRHTAEFNAAKRELRRRNGETRGVPCAATTTSGHPCRAPALHTSNYCVAHDPDQRPHVLARLADARTRNRA
jgi:hypothetical protein